jgi:hypothetical protein
VALFVALGGGAYAATGGSFVSHNGVIKGCVTKKGGQLVVVKAGKKCPAKTVVLLFNQKGRPGQTGAQGTQGARGTQGVPGAQGVPGPTASGYAQNQNGFVFVDSGSDTTAVQLTANGGSPVIVSFPARLHVTGVVRLRNNTGSGNTDQSGCRPQIAPTGGAFTDAGPEMLGLTNGFNSFNDEATIALVGERDVAPGSYDARIVCHRTFSSGSTDQNKFNGDAISVIAVAR